MGNQFNQSNYPTKEPKSLIAGDRWAWKRTDLGGDYPPVSYTLTYSARLDAAGSTEIEITASASGSDFVVEVGQSTTAAYTAGNYHWQAYITRISDSERITIDSGSFKLEPNRNTSIADPRSHARIMLDAIEAALENRATSSQLDILSTAIGSRSMATDPLKLVPLRDKYKAEVLREEQAEAIKRGEGHKGRILTRFVA